jgi:uncharacterized protein GlcG (DUF336 family)
MPKSNGLTLAAARQIIFAAETKAYQLASPSAISIVDVNGQLIAHVHMDGAPPGQHLASTQKARNALAVGLCLLLHRESGGSEAAKFEAFATKVYGDELPIEWDDEVIGTLKLETGGIVVKSEGRVLGAIGVSSGTADDDHTIAAAALNAYSSCQINDQASTFTAEPSSRNSFFEFR